jgi:hypothetical protein
LSLETGSKTRKLDRRTILSFLIVVSLIFALILFGVWKVVFYDSQADMVDQGDYLIYLVIDTFPSIRLTFDDPIPSSSGRLTFYDPTKDVSTPILPDWQVNSFFSVSTNNRLAFSSSHDGSNRV